MESSTAVADITAQNTAQRSQGDIASALSAAAGRDYSNEKKIRGKIARLYYSSETFCTGLLYAATGPIWEREIKFSIKSAVRVDEDIILHGDWQKHATYGWQFVAKLLEYPMPECTLAGLTQYLATNTAFKGIGPVRARQIAEKCAADFDRIIREEPQIVADAGKMKLEAVLDIQREWIARADLNAISTWLAAFGLTQNQIKRIADTYGNRARQVLSENPYILCDELHGFGFARTDEVALKMGTDKAHPGRIRACLIDLVKSEADDIGHTWIERKALSKAAVAKLAFDTLAAEHLVSDAIDELCSSTSEDGEQESAAPLICVELGGYRLIAFRAIYNREMELYRWFAASQQEENRPQRVCNFCLEELVRAVTPKASWPNEDQARSIFRTMNSRIFVMSGSAGTGKSFTIATIHRIFRKLDRSVALCAPTGKAAKRMSFLAEGANASTIHRLLGWNPVTSEWTFNKDNKLDYDLIVVDEVSMCDIRLLHNLFSAIDLSRTQVLMVGDHNQLPPIGAGNVLRDVLEHKILPSHTLTQCIRAAGELKLNCNAILAGEIHKSTDILAAGGREWHLLDTLEDPELVIESLRRLMDGRFESWGFDPIRECQIITPYNKGRLGVARINAEMQRIWQLRKYGVELPPVPTDDKALRSKFLIGDKVMQIKNDYKLGPDGVMNGTQGIVVAIGPNNEGKQSMSVQFDDIGEAVEIEQGSDAAKNVVLAYAVTIHKVQGSEYPCVVSVIHKMHAYMLSRNLIYTAATRARRTAILIGDKVGMRRAARTTTPMERRTWMSLAAQEARSKNQNNGRRPANGGAI